MFKGDKLNIMLFGESHGACVGVCVEGMPAGIPVNQAKIDEYSLKRKGLAAFSTPRREPDQVKILSGVFNNYTTGGQICAIIENTDTRSKDYTPNIPRPSHADYTARGKYEGFNDYRGGGMFSGRLTAALVFVGALSSSILDGRGVTTGSHIVSVHNACEAPLNMVNIDADTLKSLNALDIPVLETDTKKQIEAAILCAKEAGDSVGGVIECATVGYPPFIGGNYFNRLNSKIAQLIFSIPAFCGLEFGAGFSMARAKGSQVNDHLHIVDDTIETKTNNSGGVNGGISNGMPIVLRCAVKPTPSIHISQSTVDLCSNQNVEAVTKGRHDPCIALRATIVLKSMVEIALLDSML